MFRTLTSEDRLRAEVVRVCRLMSEKGFVSGWAGNVSARLDDDRVIVTPAGVPKAFVAEDELVVVDLAGGVTSAPPGLRPTSETPMHLCTYRRRPDVRAAVHAHPVHTVALSVAGGTSDEKAFDEAWVPEAIVVLGDVAVTPYATPSTAENECAVAAVIDRHDTVVLRYHGSFTVGRTPTEAYLRLETLEHAARIIAATRALGGGPPLPPEQIAKLVAQRARPAASYPAPSPPPRRDGVRASV